MADFDLDKELTRCLQVSRTSKSDKYRAIVYAWRRLYREIRGEEYGEQANHIHIDGKLFDSCRDLKVFCDRHGLNYEHYVTWGLTNLDDICAPGYLLLAANVNYYKSTFVNEGSTGYYVIETGKTVDEVFKEDGQVLLELPESGEAYDQEGNLIHVVRGKQ
jgi:hypothetical protein